MGATSFHTPLFTSRSRISCIVPIFQKGFRYVAPVPRRCCRQRLQHSDPCIGNDRGGPRHASTSSNSPRRSNHRRKEDIAAFPTIDLCFGCNDLGVDSCPCLRGDRLVTGLRDRRRRACWRRPPIFCIRELHDAWLWRRNAGGALAAAWTNDGDERRAHVRLVDCCYFRGAAKSGEIRRRGGERWFRRERLNIRG